jgi:hypothetical protein
MDLQEFDDMWVWENDFTHGILVVALVWHHYWNEVDETENSLLVLVHLRPLEVHNFITFVFQNVQVHFFFQNEINDVVVSGLKQLQDVIPVQLEVRIINNSLF